MLTISCYTFHPLFARFVTLWRHVQLVSAWLSCIVVTVCCPCCGDVPFEGSEATEKPSFEAFKIIPEPMAAPARSQHLIIDFDPQAGDMDTNGRQLPRSTYQTVSKQDIMGRGVSPPLAGAMPLSPLRCQDPNIPGVHSPRTARGAGTFVVALESSSRRHFKYDT